jgi:hypothetical protein
MMADAESRDLTSEAEVAYSMALYQFAALIKKLIRARRRCVDIEIQIDAQITKLNELRQAAAQAAEERAADVPRA